MCLNKTYQVEFLMDYSDAIAFDVRDHREAVTLHFAPAGEEEYAGPIGALRVTALCAAPFALLRVMVEVGSVDVLESQGYVPPNERRNP